MDQPRQHDIEASALTSADPENGTVHRHQESETASTPPSQPSSVLSKPQDEDPPHNGHVRMSRTPSMPPPSIRPRKQLRLRGPVWLAVLLLIVAMWWFTHGSSSRGPQTGSSVELQATYEETMQALQAARLELESVQSALRTEQTGQPGRLNARLSQALQTLIQSKTVTLRREHERIVVGVERGLLFEPGRTALRPEGRRALDHMTVVLQHFPRYRMRIQWHTHLDDIEKPKLDRWAAAWQVAALQAASASFYLTEQGLLSDRFSTTGAFLYRFSGPRDPGSRDARPHVEIVLYPVGS